MSDSVDGHAPQNPSEKAKGKQVATPAPDHERPAPTGQDNDSLISRVGQSAAGLSRSIFHGKPSADDVATISSTDKAVSSPSKAPVVGESSATQLHRPGVSTKNAFRSHTDAHTASEEAAFSDFLDDTSVFVPTEPVGLQSAWPDDASFSGGPRVHVQAFSELPTSVEQQQLHDGEDVLRLLASADEVLDYDADVFVSESELSTLRAALFGEDPENHPSVTEWDSLLNFIPNSLRLPGDVTSKTLPVAEAETLLGVSDPAEAGHIWLEQWHRVLTSYTDEVWGDLGALVRRAQEEIRQIEEAQPEQPPPETKALNRLRQILAHIRG